ELAPAAARRAAGLRSHREAAAQYARALRFAFALPAAERAALEEGRSYECYLTSQLAEARDARQRALGLWRPISDRVKGGERPGLPPPPQLVPGSQRRRAAPRPPGPGGARAGRSQPPARLGLQQPVAAPDARWAHRGGNPLGRAGACTRREARRPRGA